MALGKNNQDNGKLLVLRIQNKTTDLKTGVETPLSPHQFEISEKIDGKWTVRPELESRVSGNLSKIQIEEKEYFYDTNVIAQITTPKDLEITFNPNFRYNSVNVGYSKAQKNSENPYGNGDYNSRSIYGAPVKYIKNSLELTSEIRADATGIQICLDNLHIPATEDNTQTEFDNEIFVISSYVNGGILRSRNDYEYTIYNSYGDNDSFLNIDISPARNLRRSGNIIRTFLDKQTDKSLMFQKSEGLSKVGSKHTSETSPIFECADVPIISLNQPFLSEYEANFNAPFGIDEIFMLKNNPYGIVRFWDYINNDWQYGWIEEVSTEPIDKKTNWRVSIISQYVTPIPQTFKLKMLSGDYFEYFEGGNFVLLNQN